MGRLQQEIKKRGPFQSLEQEVFLNLVRTVDQLSGDSAQLLRRQGLTGSQYNVLRILRGAAEPLPCSEIAERMIARDPDMTRLLDTLERQGWISRTRSQADRRMVLSEITPAGLALLAPLDSAVVAMHAAQFKHVTRSKLQQLNALLEEVRPPRENKASE
ncbi:MAG TPA: MarR family transcriptional regulator [Pirellulales bacterium]|jgi:DNA-binding MarR family transcriptional regulator